MGEGGRSICAILLYLLVGGCAHEVIRLDPDVGQFQAPHPPIALTIALQLGPFEDARLSGEGVLDHFAEDLRQAGLFQGVMYPVPAGEKPVWEIELAGHDSAHEPNSNFWKSALASALFPLAPFIYLQNDYTLELEALLLKNRELVRSYRATSSIRHRYKAYANKTDMALEGFAAVVDQATDKIMKGIAADAHLLSELNDR